MDIKSTQESNNLKKCVHCGKLINLNDRFCTYCGKSCSIETNVETSYYCIVCGKPMPSNMVNMCETCQRTSNHITPITAQVDTANQLKTSKYNLGSYLNLKGTMFVFILLYTSSLTLTLVSNSLMRPFTLITYILNLSCLIVYCVWIYYASKNLHCLKRQNMSFTVAMAVAFQFIPLANIVLNFFIFKEFYNASQPHKNNINWKNSKTSAFVIVWFVFEIIHLLMTITNLILRSAKIYFEYNTTFYTIFVFGVLAFILKVILMDIIRKNQNQLYIKKCSE